MLIYGFYSILVLGSLPVTSKPTGFINRIKGKDHMLSPRRFPIRPKRISSLSGCCALLATLLEASRHQWIAEFTDLDPQGEFRDGQIGQLVSELSSR